MGIHGNTCQVCFSDCNQLINKGEVYVENRAIHKLCILNPKQITQSLSNDQHSQEHNKVNSIHHRSWKELTQQTHITKQQTQKRKFQKMSSGVRTLVGRPDGSIDREHVFVTSLGVRTLVGRPDGFVDFSKILKLFDCFSHPHT